MANNRYGLEYPSSSKGGGRYGLTYPDSDSDKAPDTGIGSLVRSGLRTAARIGEGLVGLPADAFKGALQLSDIASHGLGYAAGALGDLTGSEALGKASENLSKANAAKIGDYLPTSENIRNYVTKPLGNAAKNVTGTDPFEAQSKGEERWDEVVSDLTAFLHPAGGAAKGSRLLRNIALPIGANAAKWLTEDVTDSEEAGSAVKLGTLLIGTFAGGAKELTKKASQLFEDALSKPNRTVDVSNTMKKAATEIIKEVGSTSTPSKDIVSKYGKELLNTVSKSDKISLGDLVSADQDLNELLRQHKDILDKNPRSYHWFNKFKNSINETIKATKQEYPDFFNSYTEAKSIYGGLKKTDAIRDSLEKVARGKKFKSPFTSYFLLKHPANIPKVGAVMGAAQGLVAPYKFLSSMLRSPYIMSHYARMMKSAAHGKLSAALKELEKLDNAFSEENYDY